MPIYKDGDALYVRAYGRDRGGVYDWGTLIMRGAGWHATVGDTSKEKEPCQIKKKKTKN